MWTSVVLVLPHTPTLTMLRQPSNVGGETSSGMGLTAPQLILALDETLNNQEFPAASVLTPIPPLRVEPLKADPYLL